MTETAGRFIGALFSNFLCVNILVHFAGNRYRPVYKNKKIYQAATVIGSLLMSTVNLGGIPLLNFICYALLVTLGAMFLFADEKKTKERRALEMLALLVMLSIAETLGIIFLELLAGGRRIEEDGLFRSLLLMFSAQVVVLLYYFCIGRLWKEKEENLSFLSRRRVAGILLAFYSAVNLLLIVVVHPVLTGDAQFVILFLDMGCVLMVDMYLLYFFKFTEENGKLRMKLGLLEQQSGMQYEFYRGQEEQYRKTLAVLHDVNKHIRMIGELYRAGEEEQAMEYTNQIGGLLRPLVPEQYTDQTVLNILLNEKKNKAEEEGITLDIRLGKVDLRFMKPMEITTVFGNLLDNAIEGCKSSGCGSPFIDLRMEAVNEMIMVKLRNPGAPVKGWKDGLPLSSKEGHCGLGLSNVRKIVEQYNGNITCREERGIFSSELFWNSSRDEWAGGKENAPSFR